MKLEDSYVNPKNWFLSKKEKQKLDARRRYYGENLDRALLDIQHEDKKSLPYRFDSLLLDKKYGRINEENYDRRMAKLGIDTEKERSEAPLTDEQYEQKLAMANLDLDRKYKMVDDQEYERNKATINKEPYVTVVKVHFEEDKPNDGFFELDWNDLFVEKLIAAGYKGKTKELVVKEWFDALCNNIARENGAVFPEVAEEFNFKTARKVKSDDGKIEVL